MARAQGMNATLLAAFESIYGVSPVTGFNRVPFISSNIGAERPLIESNLLGLGRQTFDPVPDVTTNTGEIVVPVDTRNFGFWLKGLMGAPVSTGTAPTKLHTFNSGAIALPSMSIETGHAQLPGFFMNYGCRIDRLSISAQRRGLLDATIGIIGQGENAPAATSAAGTPALTAVDRFAQATGTITRDSVVLGYVVDADFTYSNNFEAIETIRPNGEILDADPGRCVASGNLTVRVTDTSLLTAARNSTPMSLNYGWQRGTSLLTIDVPRVILPLTKMPVEGPNGIMAKFSWQASVVAPGGNACAIYLTNDVAAY